jgi:hypothetical protein
MMPEAITLLLKEATEAFTVIEGKPLDDDILAIRETLLPLLMDIPFDLVGGIHSLTGLITETATYKADHGNTAFVRPTRLPLYDSTIPDDATTVVRVKRETAHKALVDNYASYKAAEQGVARFLREVADDLWINDLKDANTFYTKVTALKIMAHLNANSRGLHAIDMIALRTAMQGYYEQADGIPQYIALLEDAQKKAKRAQMPIADAELVMMASTAVLAVQHFPREVEDWEGLTSTSRTWPAWKTAFCLAHLKRQQQILASKGGEPLGGAHAAIPVNEAMEAALDNLALAATSDKATVQQLTAANLALTTKVATLTATNKKLVDAAAKKNTGAGTGASKTPDADKPVPGGYCWTHGHRVRKSHTSKTCMNKAEGHDDKATSKDTKGGSKANKDWHKD